MSLYKVILRDPEIDLTGFIVIDTLVNNMSAGGLRMSSNVSLEEVEELATVMTKKYKLAGVEMGGAKSGIIYHPEKHDRDMLIKRFAQLAQPLLVNNYLLGEDLGVTLEDVESIYKTIQVDPVAFVIERLAQRGIKVNVPPEVKLSTLFNNENAMKLIETTIMVSTKKALEYLGKSLSEMTVGIQGFGSIGQVCAQSIYKRGGKVIAVEDLEGCIYCKDGLDIPNLISKTRTGIIDRGKIDSKYELKRNGSWLEEAELLIPAAVKHSINETNVKQINGSVIIEAANVAIASNVEQQLIDQGILVIPDFICNSGTAAFFGMLISGQADLETIFDIVQSNIENSLVEILDNTKNFAGSVREAAEDHLQKLSVVIK